MTRQKNLIGIGLAASCLGPISYILFFAGVLISSTQLHFHLTGRKTLLLIILQEQLSLF